MTANGSTGKAAFLRQVLPELFEDYITWTERGRTLRPDGFYAAKNSEKTV